MDAATIEISPTGDRIVLHFETPKRSINAYALASTLVALADAVREANSIVNPGFDVEVVVETLEEGSFRAVIRTVLHESKNLFTGDGARNILLGIVSSFIYDKLFIAPEPIQVRVTDNMVIVENGAQRVVIPKEIYDATKRVEQSERFRESVDRMVKGAGVDEDVEGLGLGVPSVPGKPPLYVPRDKFVLLDANAPVPFGTREVTERARLEISRAILERGARKWEFYWRGVRISAPVLDSRFYDDFFAHRVKIAPGDALEVRLRITQQANPDTGIFVNVKYEVLEVLNHVPRMQQGEDLLTAQRSSPKDAP